MCGNSDGYNVVGFLAVVGASAVTCKWANETTILEADIAYNTDAINYRFVRTITSNCGHSIHLDSSATHEVGHVYDLRDTVDWNLLTMYHALVRCSEQKASLGMGDYDAIRFAY